MIFRWLCLKKMKAPFRPYLSREQLSAVFSDVRLSEWDAFRFFVGRQSNTCLDATLGPEAGRKLEEIIETARETQGSDSSGGG